MEFKSQEVALIMRLRPSDDHDERTVDGSNRSSARLAASSTILIDLTLIWMPQKYSRSPVRTHMPFSQP